MLRVWKTITSISVAGMILLFFFSQPAVAVAGGAASSKDDLYLTVPEHDLTSSDEGDLLELWMYPGEKRNLTFSLTSFADSPMDLELLLSKKEMDLGESSLDLVNIHQPSFRLEPEEQKSLTVTLSIPADVTTTSVTTQLLVSGNAPPLPSSSLGASLGQSGEKEDLCLAQKQEQIWKTEVDPSKASLKNMEKELLSSAIHHQITLKIHVTPQALFSLTLTSVPSFLFGTANPIPTSTTLYTASAVTGRIAVSDSRLTSGGWRLTAQLGNFSNPSYPSPTKLQGAQLILPAPDVRFGGVTIVIAPTASPATLVAAESQAHNIMTAALNVTLGTWYGDYTPSTVKLRVFPGTAYGGTNTGTITWTLYDSP